MRVLALECDGALSICKQCLSGYWSLINGNKNWSHKFWNPSESICPSKTISGVAPRLEIPAITCTEGSCEWTFGACNI